MLSPAHAWAVWEVKEALTGLLAPSGTNGVASLFPCRIGAVRYETCFANSERMKSWILSFLILFLFLVCSAGHAQSNAQLTLSQANVDAGESVSANLTLENAAACDTGVLVFFYLENAGAGQQFALGA